MADGYSLTANVLNVQAGNTTTAGVTVVQSNQTIAANITANVATGGVGPAGTGGGSLAFGGIKTSAFTAAPGFYYDVNAASGAITVTLPTSTGTNQISIKKSAADSSTNIVTLSGTINGTAGASIPLRLTGQGKTLFPDGTGGWYIYAGDLGLPQLDARYLQTATGIAGYLSAGTNVTVTGAGTTASPYVISSTGGGGGAPSGPASGDLAGNYPSPRVNSVTDSNGNLVETFTSTTSAVNYVDIKNNATTFSPTISAFGSDTNIDLNFVPKGTGRLRANGVLIPTTISSDALSNKTLSGSNNTFSNIPESAVTNLVSDLAGKQPTGNYITALTGDVTASGPGSSAATLTTVNSNVGSFTNANVTVDAKGRITAVTSGSAGAGSVTNYFNDKRIDQAGGGTTPYGTLTGTINGTNTDFTVSNGSYTTGTLEVILTGQQQTIGTTSDVVELVPGSGTFRFATAPATGSIIQAIYTTISTSTNSIPTTLFTSSTTQPVNNTTARTAVFSTVGKGSNIIPANYSSSHRKLTLTVYGTYQTPLSPGSVLVEIEYGGTVIADVSIAATILATQSTVREIFGEVHLIWTGVNTVRCNGWLEFEIASGTTRQVFSTASKLNNVSGTYTVPGNVANALMVYETWSNAQNPQGTQINNVSLEGIN